MSPCFLSDIKIYHIGGGSVHGQTILKIADNMTFHFQAEEERQQQLRERARRLIAEARLGMVNASSFSSKCMS